MATTIQTFLAAENLVCSHDGIAKFIKVFEHWGLHFCRQPSLGRPSRVHMHMCWTLNLLLVLN